MVAPEYPPCRDCGEERGTCPEGRCRDCDIEDGLAHSSCRACKRWIIREEYGGPVRDQHAPDCPLREDAEYGPRDDAEYRAVRKARYDWAPPPA